MDEWVTFDAIDIVEIDSFRSTKWTVDAGSTIFLALRWVVIVAFFWFCIPNMFYEYITFMIMWVGNSSLLHYSFQKLGFRILDYLYDAL